MTAYYKNIFRTIFGNKKRYIVCLAIIALGIAVFMGLSSTAPSMRKTADNFYKEQNVFDFHAESENGILSQDDINKLNNINRISSIYFAYSTYLYIRLEKEQQLVQIHSISPENKINSLKLTSGYLPKDKNECVIEETLAQKFNLSLGSKLNFVSSTANYSIEEIIEENEMTVTGFVSSPLYISNLGLLPVFMLSENFSLAKTKLFTDCFFTFEKDISSYFSKEYQNFSENKKEELNKDFKDNNLKFMSIKENSSYQSLKNNADSIEAISSVFPLVFLLVSLLVIFTVVVRFVEFERTTAGTFKSLGYSFFQIFNKYLLFSVLIAIPGSLLGILWGFWFFPTIIYNFGYSLVFIFPKLTIDIYWNFVLISVLIAFISVLLPCLIISLKNLSVRPALLIRPKAIPPGKRIFLEKVGFIWKRLSFSMKVTIRNIFRAKQRVIMFIGGIAGCTALVLAGFGLNDSIKSIIERQYNRISFYDYELTLKEGGSFFESEELKNYLNNSLVSKDYVENRKIKGTSDDFKVEIYALSDYEKWSEYMRFYNAKTKKPFLLEDNSVIISEKLARENKLKIGDNISFVTEKNNYHFKVTEIAENYIGHFLILGKEAYRLYFQEELIFNNIFGKLNASVTEEEKNDFAQKAMTLGAVGELGFVKDISLFYSEMIESISFIVIVVIISGGLLAFITLFCLISINIDERNRELATLKVLGFTDYESALYIFRENFILGAFSIFLGLFGGIYLHSYIITVAEIQEVTFVRDIKFLSFIYSGIITFSFMLITSLIMNRNIRKTNMVEALKSVE